MKKILTILALSAIALTSVFAAVQPSGKSAEVQLVTFIEETQVSYNLFYQNDLIKDKTKKYEIGVNTLTEKGDTKDFSIKATSNMNSDLSVRVFVKPDSFKTTLNQGKETFDSKIIPDVNTKVEMNILDAGKQVNTLVNKFNLSWNGNAELPAGNYVSEVKIIYSIV